MIGSFLFLGTGASAGVPIIGCPCPICASTDSKNKRLRPSGLLEVNGKVFLIDIGPDFRQQALRHDIRHLDGLLLTHTHYDHIAGIDELRVMNYRQQRPFPCLMSEESYADLQRRYYYLFEEQIPSKARAARIDCCIHPKGHGVLPFQGLQVGFVSYVQQGMGVSGFRIGNFAYISDIREFDEGIYEALHGVETLVLSSLGSEPSNAHFSFEEAVQFGKRLGVKNVWLSHLSHKVDYETALRELPPHVRPAYDGLTITFEVPIHA